MYLHMPLYVGLRHKFKWMKYTNVLTLDMLPVTVGVSF